MVSQLALDASVREGELTPDTELVVLPQSIMGTVASPDLVSSSSVVQPRNVGHASVEMLGDGSSQTVGSNGDNAKVPSDDGGLDLANLAVVTAQDSREGAGQLRERGGGEDETASSPRRK